MSSMPWCLGLVWSACAYRVPCLWCGQAFAEITPLCGKVDFEPGIFLGLAWAPEEGCGAT